jgi:transcriptional regulator GlxA family with amidase domain
MHVVVALALPTVESFDLAIPAQVFGDQVIHAEQYRFSVCAPTPGLVPTTTGYAVQADRGLEALADADTVVVPGFLPLDNPGEVVCSALREAAARGARVVSVCTGAFALAAAGLLEHRRADYGTDAAIRVARRMVVAPHRDGGQAQWLERPVPLPGQGLAPTCEWALEHLADPLTVADLARQAGWAPRTFSRQFVAETGMTPLRWLTAARVREARRLLEVSDLPVEQIAERSGLGSTANLRVHLARDAGTTPTAYRAAYQGRPR